MAENKPHGIPPLLHADWPAPPQVHTLISTRQGGVSLPPFHSLNPAAHVGDSPDAVAENRRRIQAACPLPIGYLNQVHGTAVAEAASCLHQTVDADAVFDREGRAACAVLTADCLPVLFCHRDAAAVAAAHAGWRGLAAGILENTVRTMALPPAELMAYLGPAIGANAFQVGGEVRAAFTAKLGSAAETAFRPQTDGKYLADLCALARLTLHRIGINAVYGGTRCTFTEADVFHSYRRDGAASGRILSAVWLA